MFVLRLKCCDKPGIVAAVATCLANNQCNIEESSQFHDEFSNHFFMRVVFDPLEDGCLDGFKTRFVEIAETFDITWDIFDLTQPVKNLLMVSKDDHCLNDLLYRHRTKQLNIDITGVASNHETHKELVTERGIPFHYLPITKDTKPDQEAQISEIIKAEDVDLIVLARYMQILSSDMCEKHAGHIINIHHSFLPGFKGAKPYHQAYERGVKIIGATAHFATPDLDEGPIIEQETVRITHADTPRKLQVKGRDTESLVLARAIQLYTERRVFLHDKRTIIL